MTRFLICLFVCLFVCLKNAAAEENNLYTVQELYYNCAKALSLKEYKKFLDTKCSHHIYGIITGYGFSGLVVNNYTSEISDEEKAFRKKLTKDLKHRACFPERETGQIDLRKIAEEFISYVNGLDSEMKNKTLKSKAAIIATTTLSNFPCKNNFISN